MVDVNIGYASVNSSGQPIYKTTNGGTNWFSVSTPLTGNIKSIKAIDANTVYIGAGFGTTRMAKSTNGGTDWTPISLPISVDISGIDFMDADTGYVCGNSTTVVCRTTNGGSNWTFENLHLPTLVTVKVFPNDIAFATGTFGSIMRFDPHGFVPVELVSFTSSVSGNKITLNWITATELNNRGFEIEKASIPGEWEKIGFVAGSGTTTEPRSYSFIDNDLNLGKYYYRLRQIDYSGTFEYSDAIEVKVSVPFDFALEQNYPNPFNPITNIRYSVPQNSMVNIKVYNIVGQEVAEIVNEVKSSGRYEINFESNGLASGIYLVKMQAGDFTSMIKMTLLK